MKTFTIDRPVLLARWLTMADNNYSLVGGGCNTPAVVMREYFSQAVEVAHEVTSGRFGVTSN